jgi:glycosyltransferase involved in cell wall biosynthesis
MSATPLSVAVITLNEEKKIGACLSSVAWADEIVVVDAGSTDRTREICMDPHAAWAGKIRVTTRGWTGFRDQRNHSLDLATHDWVLVIDADEECSPELKDRLLEMLRRPGGPERQAYKINRREFFMGKPIFHGMWSPSYQDRFFNRRGVRYVNEVHEYPKFHEAPGRIHELLLHNADMTIERYLEKLNRYTTLEAKDRFEQGQRTHLFRMVFAFPAHFLKSLFYYEARKDGVHGVVISLLEGVSRVVRQLKIWQLMQNEKRKLGKA